MKYMLIMRATDEAYAEHQNVDFEQIIETIGRFNDEMISAGVLVAAEGLDDASKGVLVDYSSQRGHRAAVSEAGDAVGAVWRIESARIVGALARHT